MNKMLRPNLGSEDQTASKRVLNVGSGSIATSKLHAIFQGWGSVRLDIDANVKPDIVGTISDMSRQISDCSFDAVWSSHNLEHLYPQEVMPALKEFKRVLKTTGIALITCPDLIQVAELVLKQDIGEPAYVSAAGPIAAIDMLYGHTASIARGNKYMAHHTGFTASRLGAMILDAGFDEAWVASGKSYDLWGVAFMKNADRNHARKLLSATEQAFLVPK